jgi:hypothetical protein
MSDENLSKTEAANAWLDAMRSGDDLETQKRADDARRSATADNSLAEPAMAVGRLVGTLTKASRENRKAEREHLAAEKKAADERQKQIKPRNDKPKFSPDDKLALQATIGHVTFDPNEVYAWYAIAGISHGFHPVHDIESAISTDAIAYSTLQGRRLKIRSTTRPYSVSQWAKDTYDDAEAAGHPIPEFGPDFLVRSQRHMQASSFSEKWVYLGVRVSTFRKYSKDPLRELNGLRKTLDDLATDLASSSLRATPATTEDMEWLIRRSVCLGVPMPRIGVAADYEKDDIAALEAVATWTSEPVSKHLTVTGKVPGSETEISMKVSVLTLGRLSDQVIPQEQQTGWMQRTDRLGFPVEWVATIDVIPEQRTQGWIRGRMDLIRDQMKHYVDEHDMAPPASLNRHMAIATDIQSQLDSDHGGTAIRTTGWYRVAVAAPNEALLNERVAKLRQVYGARAELVQTPNQYHTAREFIPGEPLSTGAHRRRMSVTTLAAAIPQGTAEVGDKCGVVLGYTAGSAMRAVAWHPHWDMERRDRSGLLVLAGGLGSGKTFALGGIVYQSVMSGVQWSVLDPSDRLGRLCELPELKGRARYINLMKGRSGELNPFRVVADPRRDHFDSDTEYERALSDAQGTRTSLMTDILYSFLTKSTRETSETDSVLTRAMSEVAPSRTASPTDVLAALEKIARGDIHEDLDKPHRIKARDLLITYRRLASTPVGKLIFPPENAPPLDDFEDDDILLSVYTLNGMSIPSADVIASGNIPEPARLSMSVMTLAAWLVQSRIYLGDPHRRKGLAIDEGKTITTIDAGKNLITKTATDSRKFNLRAILCSQNVTHFDMDSDSEDSLGNLIGAALIGSTEDEAAIDAALKALRAPLNEGYGAILKTLRPPQGKREEITRDLDGVMTNKQVSDNQKRHFIFSDGRNIERIVLDMDAHPHVADALNSRPSSYGDAGEPVELLVEESESTDEPQTETAA